MIYLSFISLLNASPKCFTKMPWFVFLYHCCIMLTLVHSRTKKQNHCMNINHLTTCEHNNLNRIHSICFFNMWVMTNPIMEKKIPRNFVKRILKEEYFIIKYIYIIVTIAYNMKGCLRFFFLKFIFWILSNMAKYIYGWLSLEQHHKMEKKRNQLSCRFFM